MLILLYRGKGIINSLIRWQTRSHYAHAAIYHEGRVIESLPKTGVQIRFLNHEIDGDAHCFAINESYSLDRVCAFLRDQIGRGYDYLGVLRFITREKSGVDRRWFCSELVYAAFQAGGLSLLNENEAYKVSPALLALSPFLVRTKQA